MADRQTYSRASGTPHSRPTGGAGSGGARSLATRLVAVTAAPVRPLADFFRDEAAGEALPRTPLGRFWRATRLSVLLVPLALIGALLWVIWTRTASVPYWDEWDIVELDQHLRQGTLRFHELVMFHATAHRIIIPRIIELTLINLTDFNRQIEMTFDLGIAVASACLLFWCIRRTLGSVNWALAALAPLALLFFSFAQFGNWFAPFQIQFIITGFAVICCVRGYVTLPPSRKGFALAVAGALIGSLSGLHGVLIWIAFLPGALFAGVRKAVVWIGCGVIVWVLYFQHFPHTPTRPGIRADIAYTLSYLGGAVGYPHVPIAQVAAAVSIVLFGANIALYWWRHKDLRHIAPWLQLAVFVFGCAQATAQGRLNIGDQQAIASRYVLFSALWWIALIVIMVLNIKELLPDWRLSGQRALTTGLGVVVADLVVLLLITAGLVPVNVTSMQQALLWQDTQRQNQYAIRDYRTAPESCLELYFPWRGVLVPRVQFLEQERLSVFSAAYRSRPGAVSPTAPCQKPYGKFIDNAVPSRARRWVGRAGPA